MVQICTPFNFASRPDRETNLVSIPPHSHGAAFLMVLLPAKSDVSLGREYKLAAIKTEMIITFERFEISTRFQLLTPKLSTRPELDVTLSALPDITRCWPTAELEMAATETESSSNY